MAALLARLHSREAVVTTAGTAVQISTTSLAVTSFVIRAKRLNTGRVYVGKDTVDDTVNDGLGPEDSLGWTADGSFQKALDLSLVYVDSDNNGDGVDVFYVELS